MVFRYLQIYRKNRLVPVSPRIKNLDSPIYKAMSKSIVKRVKAEDCVCVLVSPSLTEAIFISELGYDFGVTLSELNGRESYRNQNHELKFIPNYVGRRKKTFQFKSLVNDFINNKKNIRLYKQWYIDEGLTLEQYLSLEG